MSNASFVSAGILAAFFFAHEPYYFCAALGLFTLTSGTLVAPAVTLVAFVAVYSAVEPDFIALGVITILAMAAIRRYFIFIR
jgi:hypothetical protein